MLALSKSSACVPSSLPLGDAPEPVVVADRPEVSDLTSERPGDRLEHPRRGIGEAVGLGDRAGHAVLRGEARRVALLDSAEAGDEHGHRAADEEHGRGHEVAAAEEGLLMARGDDRNRDRDRGHRHDQRLANRGAGGRDERADEEKLYEQRVGVDPKVDDGDHGHGSQREGESSPTPGRVPRNPNASPTWARILR